MKVTTHDKSFFEKKQTTSFEAKITINIPDVDFSIYPEAKDASDWGVIYLPSARMGSSILAKLLNEHPAIESEGESYHNVILPVILKADSFLAHCSDYPGYSFYPNTSYDKSHISPQVIQDMLNILRRSKGSKPKFCTKGTQQPTQMMKKILPNHRQIIVARNVLDAVASEFHQNFATYFNPKNYYRVTYVKIIHALESINNHKEDSHIVLFDDMIGFDRYKTTMSEIFKYFGVDADDYDYEKTYARCYHEKSVGRWKSDEYIPAFVEYLKKVDNELYNIIMDGDGIWVPEGYDLRLNNRILGEMNGMPG